MLDCNRAQAQLNNLLEGTLSAAQSAALMEHLQDCAVCEREYRALQVTVALLRQAEVPASEEARERVFARFRHTVGAETAPVRRRVAWSRPLPMGLTVAGAALVFLLAAFPMSYFAPDTDMGEPPPSPTTPFPSSGDLDRMTSLHAAQSVALQNGDTEVQQDTLADANSRLDTPDVDED